MTLKRFIYSLVCAATLLFGATLPTYAQTSREYIREKIRSTNECKSVAITRTGGDAMLYGRNGYAAKGCPSDFNKALRELHDANEELQDIHITENERWCILYGTNGMRFHNLYNALEEEMRHYNSLNEHITTVTFNDDGDWVIVTQSHFSSSSYEIQEFLMAGCQEYGQLWTVCLTDDALIAVYERGFKFLGNVPSGLREALREAGSQHDVYIVKLAGTSWFFSCTDTYWRYNL